MSFTHGAPSAHIRGMGRKESYHHGDLRAGLVEAARDLVERKGPEKLSLSDACRAAGVSTAAPYRHFADKDELLLAVALGGMERQRAAMQAAADRHPPGSEEAIAAIGLAYVRFAEAEPGVFRLMFALTKSHKDNDAVMAAGRATFGVVLAQIARREGLAPDDPAVVRRGFALWTVVHGLSFLLIDEKVTPMKVALDLPAFLADAARRFLAD